MSGQACLSRSGHQVNKADMQPPTRASQNKFILMFQQMHSQVMKFASQLGNKHVRDIHNATLD